MMKWVEISTKCERERMTALSQAMVRAGLENEVSFLEITPDQFPDVLAEAQGQYSQIRLGGEFRVQICYMVNNVPSSLLLLHTADALVFDGQKWWPRNFLIEGMQRALAQDVIDLDLSAGVFILGAVADAKPLVAALIRAGYEKFSICDPDDYRAQTFVDDFKLRYFHVKFDVIQRHMITQLPAIHSFAINLLSFSQGDDLLRELFYLNFLKVGGVWVDFPLMTANTSLAEEARTAGAYVEPSHRILGRADQVWAETCCSVQIDLDSYFADLAKASGQPHALEF